MSIEQNCMAISFHSDTIKVGRVGLANEQGAVADGKFSHWLENGKEYWWPDNGQPIPEELKTEEIRPHAVPMLAHAIIQRGLLEAGDGKIAMVDGVLSLKLSAGSVELKVLPPAPRNSQFHLGIHPQLPPVTALGNFKMVFEARNILQSIRYDNGAGTGFSISMEVDMAEISRYSLPKLFFRSHGIGNKADKWMALEEAGPLSIDAFREKELNCLTIGPKRRGGRLRRLLGELKNGIPVVDPAVHFRNPFPRGWASLFRFKKWENDFQWMNGDLDWENADQVILKAVRDRSAMGLAKIDLAFVALPRISAKTLAWYAEVQTALLEYGIPSIAMDLAAFEGDEEKRSRFLRRLALNAYVKVGGVPWLLPNDAHSDRMVLIGVGSTELREGIAGYCTLFNRDGTFRLGNASLKPSYDQWSTDLAQFVRSQIDQLANEDNWEEGDRVELIFHLPDKDRFNDLRDLKSQLKNKFLARYDCEISFIEVDYNHRDWIWDTGRRGRGIQAIGSHVLAVGQACIMDDWALLQLRSLDHPEVESPPLKISIHPDSDGHDISEFTRQVFRFAATSWRHFGLGDLPATLEYGNALTEALFQIDQAGRIHQLEKALHNHPEMKTWFL